MSDIISFSSNKNYNLRSSARSDILNSRFNTSYKKRAFSYFSMDVWNEIPTSIRDAKSIISFTKTVQTTFIERTVPVIVTLLYIYTKKSYSNIILLLIHLYFQTQQSSVSPIIIIFIIFIIITVIIIIILLIIIVTIVVPLILKATL